MSEQFYRSQQSSEDAFISGGRFQLSSESDLWNYINQVNKQSLNVDPIQISKSQNCQQKNLQFLLGTNDLESFNDDERQHSIQFFSGHQQIHDREIQYNIKSKGRMNRVLPTNKIYPGTIKSKKQKIIKKNRKKAKVIENCRSQTKNIPKNYGKEIIKFILKDKKTKQKIEQILEQDSLHFQQLETFLKGKKSQMNKISNLRSLWSGNKFEKQLRILSQYFLRKKALPWIFHSRIQKISYPIKYRAKILEGVRNPKLFENLKDY